MKILYDHQAFTMQKFGGISRYFIELMKRFPEGNTVQNSVLLTDNYYYLNEDFNGKNKVLDTSSINVKGKNRIKAGINNLNTHLKLKNNKFDIFHPTYYDHYFFKSLKDTPFVVTVYDMIHEKFSDDEKSLTLLQKKETINRADQIIAISANTKKDLIDLYGIPASRIDVVYLNHNLDGVKEKVIPELPEHYILYVGERNWYKNFENFAMAVQLVLQKHPDLHVICTGKKFTNEEVTLLKELKIESKFHQYFVTDEQLKYLYLSAKLFVYPSKYEGFGIPILEAFSCECPVVLSNSSCFPEVAGDAGVYFDPANVDDMSDKICNVLEDAELRKEKIILGKLVSAKFSWDKTVDETLAIYNKMIH